MKLLRSTAIMMAIATFVCLALTQINIEAKELLSPNYQKNNRMGEILYAPSYELPGKAFVKKDKLQADNIDFKIIDSIANAYSYYSGNQQPYIFSREVNKLITVKRGYFDLDSVPTYSGIDTKDNLFFRTSEDWGKTWTEQVLIYDDRTEILGKARYPSCYAFNLDGQFTLIYTGPVTKGDGWIGFLSGLYDGTGSANSFSPNFTQGGKSYNWGTDAKLLGGINGDGNPYALGVGGVMPPEGFRDGYDNANIAFRRTEDFAAWGGYIPPQTASNLFRPTTDNVDSRRNAMVNMRFGEPNKIYAGIFGGLVNSELEDRNEMCFTVSEDNGLTWSELNSCPISLVRYYASTIPGVYFDSCYIAFSAMDMTAFDNGDLSFVCQLYEGISDTTNVKKYEDQLHQIIEIYYEGGIWGVRRIADLTGYVLVYADPVPSGQTQRNQMGIELQVVRSIDGQTLICKWVDFVDVTDDQGVVYPRYTNDIFVATRASIANRWGDAKNITESLEYDRVTWLPDFVPNNLTGIPLLKTVTMFDEASTDEVKRNRQRLLEQKQWLTIGHFDLEPADVPQDGNIQGIIEIENIYPNPAKDFAFINFNSNIEGNVKVEIVNLLGQKMMDVYDGRVNIGVQSVTADLKGMMNGTYYCVITINGQKTIKTINIVR